MSKYRVLKIIAMITLSLLWYRVGLDNLPFLFLGLFSIDTVTAKLEESRDRGELLDTIVEWNPIIARRKTSIVITTLILVVYFIVITTAYIRGSFTLIEFSISGLIFGGYLLLDIYYSAKPLKVYRNGIKISFHFVEWENIDLSKEHNGEVVLDCRTKRIIFPTESKRISEKIDRIRELKKN